MSTQNDLRTIRRHITTHDAAGRSVFASTLHEEPPRAVTQTPTHMALGYATQKFPVDIRHEKDIKQYKHFIEEPPGIIVPDGTAARVADIPPAYTSLMHRTISVNYNFVIEGEVEIILDSGETRLMKPGDMLVQRAVNHAWRNPSSSKWSRIAAVSFPATGTEMKESGTEGLTTAGATSVAAQLQTE